MSEIRTDMVIHLTIGTLFFIGTDHVKKLFDLLDFSFRYFGTAQPRFFDRGYEIRPLSDQILQYDGTYESNDSKEHRLHNNIGQKTDQCKCLGTEG